MELARVIPGGVAARGMTARLGGPQRSRTVMPARMGGERRGAGSGGAGMGEVAGRRRGPMAAVPRLQLAAEMDNTTFAIGPSSCTIEALQT